MDNLGLIIAIVGTGMAIVGVLFGVIYWTRGEANALRTEANADRRDIVNLIFAIKEDIQAIQLEMKDFHNRLYVLEVNRRN